MGNQDGTSAQPSMWRTLQDRDLATTRSASSSRKENLCVTWIRPSLLFQEILLVLLLCVSSVVFLVITREIAQISSGSKIKRQAAGTATRLTGASTASRPTSPLGLCLRRLGRLSRPTILQFVQVLDNLSDRSCAKPLPLSHKRLSHRLLFGATEPTSITTSSSTKQI